MKSSMQMAAAKADGNSRRCEKCPLRHCSKTEFEVCTVAFREGFRKGVAWKNKQLKSKKQ